MKHLVLSYLTSTGYSEWEYRADALEIAPTLVNVSAIEVFEFDRDPVIMSYGRGDRNNWTPRLVRKVDWNVPHTRVLAIDYQNTVTVTEAAALANVTDHSVYAVLQDDKRRAAIFPGAYHTNPDNPRRGEWRIPRSEVEAWKPRRVKT